MLSLSNMCKMRNKHLKQLKGKEGTAKKCLLERRKLNLNQVLLVLQKNKKQNLLLYTAQEPPRKTWVGRGGGHQHQAEPQLAHVCTKLIASWGRFGWPLLQLLFLASICPWWGAGNRAGPNGSHPLCCNCLGSPLHHLLAVLLHTPNASYIHISRTQPL